MFYNDGTFSFCEKVILDINTDLMQRTTVDPVYLLNNSVGAYTERMAEVYGVLDYIQMWLGGDYNCWEDDVNLGHYRQ